MILTKEQIELRLNSPTNISNLIEIEREKLNQSPEVIVKDGINNHIGRGHTPSLTREQRVSVGVLGTLAGNEIAGEVFGISKETVRDLRNGHTASNHIRYQDGELKQKIQERLDDTKLSIQERAAEKLLGALGLLTEDKLENCNVRDIADVANKMSHVVRNISSNDGGNKGNGKAQVKIILHQPKTTREEAFDFVELDIK